MAPTLNAVTGAFGYTGKYIARKLLRRGETVVTLTSKQDRSNEFGSLVKAFPYRFDKPELMAEALAGVRVLYNTYWVRFDRGGTTHHGALANTIALIKAACLAGVERIVHISITNPDRDSSLPYFRGKALLEEEIRKSGLGYPIIRPAVVFGPEDILINNVAFLLRKMPAFLIPGAGQYRLQPIFVEDLATIAVEAAAKSDDMVMDAVGPEQFSFDELVHLIARIVNSRSVVLHVPPRLAFLAAQMLGTFFGDVVLTRDELTGLMANLLISQAEPSGSTALSRWLAANASTLGRTYASEVRRHYAGVTGG
jgi:NADH dehydrogenase